jgi:hypothetical protein
MLTTNLNNITIKKLQDKNFNDYYLIVNNENQDEAYFCFEKAVKEGWNDLVSNWESLKEVEIEFTESEQGLKVYRKVVSVYVPEGGVIV